MSPTVMGHTEESKVLRKVAMAVGAMLAGVVIAFGVGAAPVSASPAADSVVASADPGIMVEAPTCVSRSVYEVSGGFHVYMKNNCGITMKVRVIIDWASDSGCITLGVGRDFTYEYRGITGQYDHLARC